MKRVLVLALVLEACSSSFGEEHASTEAADADADTRQAPPRSDAYLDAPYTTLAEYDLRPELLVPYDVRNALFTDYAEKVRSIYLPAGTRARWAGPDAPIELPVGAILVKQFSYGGRKIETRLLVRSRSGDWRAHAYLWGAAQREARLRPGGAIAELDTVKANGEAAHVTHLVPSELQCKKCHADGDRLVPIGLRPTLFDHDGQLARIVEGAPPSSPVTKWYDAKRGTVEARARAYLDANCGHCHNPSGAARTTGLWLRVGERSALELGICKPPVAAGRGSGDLAFDIVPGKPDESILVRRMRSTEPQAMMPEIGRSLVHEEGVAVVAEWIATLAGKCR